MDSLCLACDGVTVGQLWIPPFQLRAREAICLHLPSHVPWEERSELVQTLTAPLPVKGLHLLVRIFSGEPPTGRGGWLGFWPSPRAVDWLRRTAGITREEASRIVARLDLRPEWRISHLAGNPRTLLGLEAAWARRAEAVVFSTMGCDPRGTAGAFAAVSSWLDRCAAIHLSYPYITNGQEGRDCFPRASCVEVIRVTGRPEVSSAVGARS